MAHHREYTVPDLVEERLQLLDRVLDDGLLCSSKSMEMSLIIGLEEEGIRAKISSCLRIWARSQCPDSSLEEASEINRYLKSIFVYQDTKNEDELWLDAEGVHLELKKVCGSIKNDAISEDEIRQVVESLQDEESRVEYRELKAYISYFAPRTKSGGRRLRPAVIKAVKRAFQPFSLDKLYCSLADTSMLSIAPGKLHAALLQHIGLDLGTRETSALLFAMSGNHSDRVQQDDLQHFLYNNDDDNDIQDSLNVKNKSNKKTQPIVDIRVTTCRQEEDELLTQGYIHLLPDCCHGRGIWFLRKRWNQLERLAPIINLKVSPKRRCTALVLAGYTCVARSLTGRTGPGGRPPRYLWLLRAASGDYDTSSNGTTSNEDANTTMIELGYTRGNPRRPDDGIHLSPWLRDATNHVISANKITQALRVDGPSISTDGRGQAFLWCLISKPSKSQKASTLNDTHAKEVTPAEAAHWPSHRRRSAAETALRFAVRQHSPPSATGAPELAAIFARHQTQHSFLRRRDFGRLLEEVGVGLELPDAELMFRRLAMSAGASKKIHSRTLVQDTISLEQFLHFFSLAEAELDAAAEALKKRFLHGMHSPENTLNKNLEDELWTELRRFGAALATLSSSAPVPREALTGVGAALTEAEFGHAIRRVGHFLTVTELRRLSARFSSLDGELPLLALGHFLLHDTSTARRAARRVAESAHALRRYLLEHGGTDAAWHEFCMTRRRRTKRLRRTASLLGQPGDSSQRDTGEDDAFLEIEEIALVLEPFAAPRLAPQEYERLCFILAPTENSCGRLSRNSIKALAAAPLRPISEICRLIEERVIRRVAPDLLPAYRHHLAKNTSEAKPRRHQAYSVVLDAALQKLGLYDLRLGRIAPVEIKDLARALEAASIDSNAYIPQALAISLTELATLAQYTAADLPSHEHWLVQPERILHGICRYFLGVDMAGEALLQDLNTKPVVIPESKQKINIDTTSTVSKEIILSGEASTQIQQPELSPHLSQKKAKVSRQSALGAENDIFDAKFQLLKRAVRYMPEKSPARLDRDDFLDLTKSLGLWGYEGLEPLAREDLQRLFDALCDQRGAEFTSTIDLTRLEYIQGKN